MIRRLLAMGTVVAATLTAGAYTGFVDAASAEDPAQGADLTAPAPEITAVPVAVWR